jgi:hypothetical protein
VFKTNQGWSVLVTLLVSVLEASGGGELGDPSLREERIQEQRTEAADSSSASTPYPSIVQVKRWKGGPQSRGRLRAAVQASDGATTVARALVMLK